MNNLTATIVLGGLFGAIVSAVLSIIFTNIREKTSRSFEIISDFDNKVGLLGNVLYYLEDKSRYSGDESTDKNTKYNKIKQIGAWYSAVAYLYLEYKINRKIIEKAGIDKDIINYYEKIEKNKFEEDLQKDAWSSLGTIAKNKNSKRALHTCFCSTIKYWFL